MAPNSFKLGSILLFCCLLFGAGKLFADELDGPPEEKQPLPKETIAPPLTLLERF